MQEFIPRGRQAVEEHPGPTDVKAHNDLSTQHVLLQRIQNVNISESDEHNEFWCVREIFEDLNENIAGVRGNHYNEQKKYGQNNKSTNGQCVENEGDNEAYLRQQQRAAHADVDYMCEYLVNSEEELYVKKNTAVWTKGAGNN